MSSGQPNTFFLKAGKSIFVGWYARDFNVATTAAFAAYPYPVNDLADTIIESGPLQVSIDEVIQEVSGPAVMYILRWQVTNVSGSDSPVFAVFQTTSQDLLPPS